MSSPAVPRAVMRVASRKFCAAVRTLHTPPTIAQMTLTGMHLILPIDLSGPVRISDERIGEEPLAVLRWEDLLALLSGVQKLHEATLGLAVAAGRASGDHRWQNLAEGLTGGRP